MLSLIMLQILLAFSLAVLAASSSPNYYPIAKPNCTNTCGHVTVPFPFGFGPGCFLDEWYEMVCINNNIPRLKKLDLEVLNISMPNKVFFGYDTTITVNYPIIYSTTSCTHGKTTQDDVNLSGGPFTFSEKHNIFVAVGCNNTAIMGNEEDPSFVGCRTECTGNNTKQYSTCSGYDCCSSTIPRGLQGYNVDFRNEDSGEKKYCQFAFLVNSSWFQPNATDLYSLRSGGYVPVVLQWGEKNVTFLTSLGLEIDPRSVAWFQPSACQTFYHINQGGARLIQCSCNYGYGGNPYLQSGCQDINECESPEGRRRCRGSCKNFQGYYKCVRNRTSMFLAIGFTSGVGLLLLIFVSRWIYKVINKRRETEVKEKLLEIQFTDMDGSSDMMNGVSDIDTAGY